MRDGRAASAKPTTAFRCSSRRIHHSANQPRWPTSQASDSGRRSAAPSSRRSRRRSAARRPAVSSAAASASPARRRRHRHVASAASVCCDGCTGPARASGLHRLAGRGRGEQRQLAHRRALVALPGAGGDRATSQARDDPGDGRPADRAACAPLGRRRSRAWRDARPAAPLIARADRHRPVSRSRPDRRARHSLERATQLVVLQDSGAGTARAATARQGAVIFQSAPARLPRHARRRCRVASPSATCAPRRIP